MNRRALLGMLCAAPVLSGCGTYAYEFNYRLEIAVRLAGVLRRGASVIGFRRSRGFVSVPKFVFWQNYATGEAVQIDCGPQGPLFGLIWPVSMPSIPSGFRASTPESTLAPHNSPYIEGDREAADDGSRYGALGALTGPYDVPKDHWPVLVRFRDRGDPGTVEWAEDAVIQSVTMTVTHDPVTHRIEKTLPWLKDLHGPLDGTRPARPDTITIIGGAPLPAVLGRRHFILNGDSHDPAP